MSYETAARSHNGEKSHGTAGDQPSDASGICPSGTADPDQYQLTQGEIRTGTSRTARQLWRSRNTRRRMMQDTDFCVEPGFCFEPDSKKEVPPAAETERNLEEGNEHKVQSVKP